MTTELGGDSAVTNDTQVSVTTEDETMIQTLKQSKDSDSDDDETKHEEEQSQSL